MHGFWKNWMMAWFALAMAFAIVLALAAWPQADAMTRPILRLIAGDAHPSSIFEPMPMRFAIGLQGALSLGWLLTMMIAMRAADRLGGQIWREITAAIAIWYGVDCAISIGTGFPLNAVSNTALVIGYLAPVLGSGVLSVAATSRAAASRA